MAYLSGRFKGSTPAQDGRLFDNLIGGRPDVPFRGGRLVGACSVAALAKNARVS